MNPIEKALADSAFTEFAQREYRNDAEFTARDVQIAHRAWVGARSALSGDQPTEGETTSLTITVGQLRDAMSMGASDEPDAHETELVLAKLPARTSTDGEPMEAGLYCWLAEYPEEGAYGPLTSEPAATRTFEARALKAADDVLDLLVASGNITREKAFQCRDIYKQFFASAPPPPMGGEPVAEVSSVVGGGPNDVGIRWRGGITSVGTKLYTSPMGGAAEGAEPQWIVNDLGELGVRVGGRFFFLYKGDNIEYGSEARDGIALHDDGTPMRYRIVGKREFGETCWPLKWITRGHREGRYTEELLYTPGLSFGEPSDGDWRDLPAAAPQEGGVL